MDEDVLILLDDILFTINKTNECLPEQRIFDDFRKDWKTKKAVERGIEIIGEAMNRLLKINPEISITNARKIVDTRNRVSHGYDTISDDIIWRIVINDLPILKSEVEKLLAEHNPALSEVEGTKI